MTTHKVTADDAGCWIDGHWGAYASARLVRIAADYGYPGEADLEDATAILASMVLSDRFADAASWDHIDDAADSAEEWLNEHVAPEGCAFGWHDGEFFLQSDEWWEEV